MTPFEFENFRKQKPIPTYKEWTPDKPFMYGMIQIFFLFVLPFLLGFALTAFGLLCNVILLDFILFKNAINNWKG